MRGQHRGARAAFPCREYRRDFSGDVGSVRTTRGVARQARRRGRARASRRAFVRREVVPCGSPWPDVLRRARGGPCRETVSRARRRQADVHVRWWPPRHGTRSRGRERPPRANHRASPPRERWRPVPGPRLRPPPVVRVPGRQATPQRRGCPRSRVCPVSVRAHPVRHDQGVARAPSNPIVWQLSLVDRELDEALRCELAAARTRLSRVKNPSPGTSGTKIDIPGTSGTEKTRIPGDTSRRTIEPGESCPICYEEMREDDSDQLVWCGSGVSGKRDSSPSPGCGRSVHGRCLAVYRDHCAACDRELTCPLCRREWGELRWSPPPTRMGKRTSSARRTRRATTTRRDTARRAVGAARRPSSVSDTCARCVVTLTCARVVFDAARTESIPSWRWSGREARRPQPRGTKVTRSSRETEGQSTNRTNRTARRRKRKPGRGRGSSPRADRDQDPGTRTVPLLRDERTT